MVVDFKWTLHEEGLVANIPTAGTDGRLYYATDEGILYYDNGLVWTNMAWLPYILKTLFGANTIIKADVNNIPEALTVAEQRLVGRITSGVITGLTPAQIMALLSGGAAAEFSFGTQKVGGVVDPTSNQQAATKKYVDDQVGAAGITSEEALMYALCS